MRYLPSEANDAPLINFELNEEERFVLRCGIVEWGGPAQCTEELAVAMGFASVHDLFANTGRLVDAIEGGQPLSRTDWFRVVLATEIVFASDLVGSGMDWNATTGLSDVDTIRLLRAVQRKVIRQLRGVAGNGVGTRPPSR